MMTQKAKTIIWTLLALGALSGCDPLTVHKVTSTVFDGVPSLPPPEQYCQAYHEKVVQEEKAALQGKQQASTKKIKGSDHRPYAEKKCSDCHDKSKEGGLIVPKERLCFVCHPNIIKKPLVHGPVAVGECLGCHEPHSSQFPALLKVEQKALCAGCHKEKRMAEEMHNKVTAKEMFCMDCHDPHSGDLQYFLR